MNQVVKKSNQAKWVYLLLVLLLAVIAAMGILPRQAMADGQEREVKDDIEFVQAFTVATDGDTIRLTDDIDLQMDADWSLSGTATIEIKKHIALDCNGHKLRLINDGSDKEKYLFKISGDGELTLKKAQIETVKGGDEEKIPVALVEENNGKLEFESTSGDGLKFNRMVVNNRGAMVIEEGRFVVSECLVFANYDEITIKSGYFTTKGPFLMFNKEGANLTVLGGVFNILKHSEMFDFRGNFVLNNEGAIEILAGEFESENNFCWQNYETGTILIEGGSFNSGDCFMDLNEGMVQIRGDSFNSGDSFMDKNDGKVEIEDGTFDAIGSLVAYNIEDSSFLIKKGTFKIHKKEGDDVKFSEKGFLSFHNQGSLTVEDGTFTLDGGLSTVNDGRILVEYGIFTTHASFIAFNRKGAEVQIDDGKFSVQEFSSGDQLEHEYGHFIYQNGGFLLVKGGDFQLDWSFVHMNHYDPDEDEGDDQDPDDKDPQAVFSIGSVHIEDARIRSACLVWGISPGSSVAIDDCDFQGKECMVFMSWGKLRIKGGRYWIEDGPIISWLLSDYGSDSDTEISGGDFSSDYDDKYLREGAIYFHGGRLVLTGGRFENRSGKAALVVAREEDPAPALTIPDLYVAYPYYWEETAAPVVEIFKKGGLTIRTEVTGPDADKDKAFLYTLTLPDKPLVHGVHGDLKFVGGVATFSLKHGDSLTASNLPAGAAFEIVESGYDHYIVRVNGVVGDSSKGAVAGGNPTVITFLNAIPQAGEGDGRGDDANGQGSGSVPSTGMRLLSSLPGLLFLMAAILLAALIGSKRMGFKKS